MCFHFARYKYFEDFGIECYNKEIRKGFPYEGQDMFQLAIIIRPPGLCGIRACVYGEIFCILTARVSESQTHMEDWLRDTVFHFPLLVTYVVACVFTSVVLECLSCLLAGQFLFQN